MITIASLIVFLAFYTLYYTSKRATLSYDLGFEKWMKSNPKPTKYMGLGLLLLAYSLWLITQSLCCGTLMFLIAAVILAIRCPIDWVKYLGFAGIF